MYSIKTLNISGFRNEPVPNTYFRQDEDTRHLAVLLPGMDYSSDVPLFYYFTRTLLDKGVDVLALNYQYNRRDDFASLQDHEQLRWLLNDVNAACQAGFAQRSYQRLTLVGKSLGTMAMGLLLTTGALPPRLVVRAVWLTPPLKNDRLRGQILQSGRRGLLVTGVADPNYDAGCLPDLQTAIKSEPLVLDGADESLEIKGDLPGSLRILEQVITAFEKFVQE